MFKERTQKIPVPMRLRETPVPIPNTRVKAQAADGTMLETAWESRWVPDFLRKSLERVLYIEQTYSNGLR